VFGVCYANRYYHGPCSYNGCCNYGDAYQGCYCYYINSKTSSCNYTINGVCYNSVVVINGICAYSRCCALDETYYDGHCYYNGSTAYVSYHDPVSYLLDGVAYSGRKYVGYCQSGEAHACCDVCCDMHTYYNVYYNNHCYTSIYYTRCQRHLLFIRQCSAHSDNIILLSLAHLLLFLSLSHE